MNQSHHFVGVRGESPDIWLVYEMLQRAAVHLSATGGQTGNTYFHWLSVESSL